MSLPSSITRYLPSFAGTSILQQLHRHMYVKLEHPKQGEKLFDVWGKYYTSYAEDYEDYKRIYRHNMNKGQSDSRSWSGKLRDYFKPKDGVVSTYINIFCIMAFYVIYINRCRSGTILIRHIRIRQPPSTGLSQQTHHRLVSSR